MTNKIKLCDDGIFSKQQTLQQGLFFPNSVQLGFKPQQNVWVFLNALFNPNETKETRNECTTDRSY